MDKSGLRDRMLALEEAELEHAVEKYRAFMGYARIDGSEPVETGEASQAEAAGELAEAFDHPVHDHAHKIGVLREIDFGPKDRVEPGAVVRLNGRNFIVAVSTDRFEWEGALYMGISVQAPVFKAIEGRKAGEPCSLNGRQLEIEAVF